MKNHESLSVSETSETKLIPRPEVDGEVVPVVRVFPWTIASVQDIILALQNGTEFSFINILLAQKSALSIPSPNMLAPIGGKCKPGENIVAAALRELREETTLQPCVFTHKNEMQVSPAIHEPYFAEEGYRYIIGDRSREVHLVTLPVLPEDQHRIHFPFGTEDDKIESIYSIPLRLAREIFKKGTVNQGREQLQLIESCVYGQTTSPNFYIDDTQTDIKDKQLDSLFNYLQQVDSTVSELVKNKMLFVLNQSYHHIAVDLQNLALEQMLLTLYQDLGEEKFQLILKRVLHEVQIEIYMAEFKKQSLQKHTKTDHFDSFLSQIENPRLRKMETDARIIKKELNSGNLGLDMLHALSFYADTDDIITARTSVVAMHRFWKNALTEAVETTMGQVLNLEQIQNYLNDLQQTNNLLAVDKFYQSLEEKIIKTLSFILEQDPEYILDALELTNRFISEMAQIANQVATMNGSLHRFQNHALSNEVNNAGLAELVLLSKGVDLSEYKPERARVIRFEAMRHILIFTKIFTMLSEYRKKTRKGTGPIARAVKAFFGPQQGVVEYRLPHKSFANQVEIRIGQNKMLFVVDEKPIKSFFSFLRKSFQAEPENIYDIFSTSIIPANSEQFATLEEQINYINQVAEEFAAFVRKHFGDDYTVEILDDRHESLDDFAAIVKGEKTASSNKVVSGKRSGSVASQIPRHKYILRLTNKQTGENYTSEFTFYPFVIAPAPYQETHMGWLEKLYDDQHYAIRRMLLDVKHSNLAGTLSFFELMFPSTIYGEETVDVRRNIARPEKNRE